MDALLLCRAAAALASPPGLFPRAAPNSCCSTVCCFIREGLSAPPRLSARRAEARTCALAAVVAPAPGGLPKFSARAGKAPRLDQRSPTPPVPRVRGARGEGWRSGCGRCACSWRAWRAGGLLTMPRVIHLPILPDFARNRRMTTPLLGLSHIRIEQLSASGCPVLSCLGAVPAASRATASGRAGAEARPSRPRWIEKQGD